MIPTVRAPWGSAARAIEKLFKVKNGRPNAHIFSQTYTSWFARLFLASITALISGSVHYTVDDRLGSLLQNYCSFVSYITLDQLSNDGAVLGRLVLCGVYHRQ